MKNLSKIAATIVASIFLFTACDMETTLTVPGDAYVDLGESFDPLQGVTVDAVGKDVEDVGVSWNPEFDNTSVGEYVATYALDSETSTRSVFVQVDKLAGSYSISEYIDDELQTDPYSITVSRGSEYNELRFNALIYPDIIIEGVVSGQTITIPSQDFFQGEITIEGSGSINGEAATILELTIIDTYNPGEDDVDTIEVEFN